MLPIKAVHTALVVSLVKQTHGITGCQCIRIAIAADPLKVATVNSVARHYGLAGIEGDGRTDGTLVGKYVLYIIVFRIGIYLQVLVQQLRTEVQRSTPRSSCEVFRIPSVWLYSSPRR